MSTAAILDAWAARSRFHALGVVLDLQDADAPALLGAIKSTDALNAVRTARKMGRRFIVLAGQLLLKRAGVFAVVVPDAEALPLATTAAAARLTDAGESWSCWFVLLDDEQRERVMATLAALTPTEGSA